MSLLNLPVELINIIATHLDRLSLSALCQTNHVLHQLLEKELYHYPDKHCESWSRDPVVWAAETGNWGTLQKAIDYDILLENIGMDVWSPLSVAAQYGRVDMVRKFIDLGLDLFIISRDNESLLHHAMSRGHCDVASELIARGLEVSWAEAEGRESLVRVGVKMRNKDLVTLVLDNGSDIEGVHFYWEPPLYSAVQVADFGLVRHLLERGANPNARNMKEGSGQWTPIWLALVHNSQPDMKGIIILLLSYGAKPDPLTPELLEDEELQDLIPTLQAAEREDWATVKEFINQQTYYAL